MIRPCPKPEKREKKPRAQLRRTWLRARRFTKQQLREGDEERLIWLRTQPCANCDAPPPSHACHEGRTGKGMGRKCIDAETFAMCWRCHRYWTGVVTSSIEAEAQAEVDAIATAVPPMNPFGGWSKERRREWATEQFSDATARYLSHGRHRG